MGLLPMTNKSPVFKSLNDPVHFLEQMHFKETTMSKKLEFMEPTCGEHSRYQGRIIDFIPYLNQPE
jgi:hypothetical protein